MLRHILKTLIFTHLCILSSCDKSASKVRLTIKKNLSDVFFFKCSQFIQLQVLIMLRNSKNNSKVAISLGTFFRNEFFCLYHLADASGAKSHASSVISGHEQLKQDHNSAITILRQKFRATAWYCRINFQAYLPIEMRHLVVL